MRLCSDSLTTHKTTPTILPTFGMKLTIAIPLTMAAAVTALSGQASTTVCSRPKHPWCPPPSLFPSSPYSFLPPSSNGQRSFSI